MSRITDIAKTMKAWWNEDDDPFVHRALDEIIRIDQEQLPTIEPKRGKWIPHKQENGKTVLWKCSECGQIIFSETETDRLEFQKWCSRCGADMRAKEGE